MTPAPSPLPLRPWLGGLAVFTALATLRTLVLPPWPHASPLPAAASLQAGLERAGLPAVVPLPPDPPRRDLERALSAGVGWRLADGQIVRLRRAEMRRWEAFQLAAITRDLRELALERRRVEVDSQGAPVAVGELKGGRALQTCLVPGTTVPQPMGVTQEHLSELVRRRPNPPPVVLAGLLGLRPMRSYDCVVISLQTPGGSRPSLATWERLVSALAPVMVVSRTGSPSL